MDIEPLPQVFLIMENYDYNRREVVSVWSSMEKAEKEIERLYQLKHNNSDNPFYAPDALDIDTLLVDKGRYNQ